jgi:hypothetical protein
VDLAQSSDFGPWLRSTLTRQAQITGDSSDRATILQARDDCLALLGQLPRVASTQALLKEELPPLTTVKGKSNHIAKVVNGRIFKGAAGRDIPVAFYSISSGRDADPRADEKIRLENQRFDAVFNPLIEKARAAGTDSAALLERIRDEVHSRTGSRVRRRPV